MKTAKLFWIGDEQAVRLPKEFHIQDTEVRIRRNGSAIVLEPITLDWSWLDALAGPLDDDFKRAALNRPTATALPETATDRRSD
jgi:antitoxin VapB